MIKGLISRLLECLFYAVVIILMIIHVLCMPIAVIIHVPWYIITGKNLVSWYWELMNF